MFNLLRGVASPLILARMSSSSSRQSKILRKLVVGKDRAKRRWYQDGETPKMQTAANLSNPARQGKNAPRRVHVLNKLFMKHITDLLSTGEASEAVLGRGLEVSYVKVAADFNYVNVFWRAKSSGQTDDEMEAILRKAAGNIRHELSQLRLMGEVPRINFVRDRQLSTYGDVQDLLDRADYGDDFQPTSWAQLRHDLAPHDSQFDRVLPEMRHDVLGLNQADIMDGIKRTMSKSKQAWEQYDATSRSRESTDVLVGRTSFLGAEVGSIACDSALSPDRRVLLEETTKLRDEEFVKFLQERRRLKQYRKTIKNPNVRDMYERDTYDDSDEDEDRFSGGGDYIEEDSGRTY